PAGPQPTESEEPSCPRAQQQLFSAILDLSAGPSLELKQFGFDHGRDDGSVCVGLNYALAVFRICAEAFSAVQAQQPGIALSEQMAYLYREELPARHSRFDDQAQEVLFNCSRSVAASERDDITAERAGPP
ncbi:MAG: hypothetical protein ABW003_17045, partial [Microvirga sp.]